MNRRNNRELALRSGLTLIETMLAMAIAVVVIGLVYSTYHAALRVSRGHLVRSGEQAAFRALGTMASELTSGTTVESSDDPPLLLWQDSTNSASVVTFYMAESKDNGSDWFSIRRVSFFVAMTNAEQALIRRVRDITGPTTNLLQQEEILLRNVATLDIVALEDGEWVEEWGGEHWPEALRISLATVDGSVASNLSTEVYIPVGNVVTSQIVRAGPIERGTK